MEWKCFEDRRNFEKCWVDNGFVGIEKMFLQLVSIDEPIIWCYDEILRFDNIMG